MKLIQTTSLQKRTVWAVALEKDYEWALLPFTFTKDGTEKAMELFAQHLRDRFPNQKVTDFNAKAVEVTLTFNV